MHRGIGRAVWLALWVAAAPSCTGGGDAPAKAAAAVDGESTLAVAEDGFLARRDALLARRVELRQRKAELDERRQAIAARGGDTSDVDREAAAVATSESGLVDEERQLNDKLDQLLAQRRAMMQQLTSGTDVAGRESALAVREKEVARREGRLADREAALSTREDGLAQRWKASCVVGGTTTIVKAADPRGTTYTKRDVEPVLAAARGEMDKRGLLAFDLPDAAQGLEAEAGRAMASGDYSTARLAASQLLKSVRDTKVDKGFIANKIGRLNARAKGKKLSSDVEQLFREATSSYGDGKFADANKKLNKIYVAIR